jgi:hypothetical protein
LVNQQLLASVPTTPAETVRRLGAVQSQDYNGAKWAVAQRAGVTDAAAIAGVEQALNEGSILRLHVLRPTWHLVAAEDARWLLALTGPRVIRGSAARHRELGIDEAMIARAENAFRRELAGGQQLSRAEMEKVMQHAGIAADVPQRLAHLLMQAELDQVLCNGAWRGKQATYALLDERVPIGPVLEREASLAEIARRYFSSHGPATHKDFCWWSGLTLGDARLGVRLAGDGLMNEQIDGQEYWSPAGVIIPEITAPLAHLLPNYDEYVVAYVDRSAIFDPTHAHRLHMRGGVLNNVALINGLVVGGWTREVKKDGVTVTVSPLWSLQPAEIQALHQAVVRYGVASGVPAKFRLEG